MIWQTNRNLLKSTGHSQNPIPTRIPLFTMILRTLPLDLENTKIKVQSWNLKINNQLVCSSSPKLTGSKSARTLILGLDSTIRKGNLIKLSKRYTPKNNINSIWKQIKLQWFNRQKGKWRGSHQVLGNMKTPIHWPNIWRRDIKMVMEILAQSKEDLENKFILLLLDRGIIWSLKIE